MIKRVFTIVGASVVISAIASLTVIGLVRWEHGTDITLPKPTGHWLVGRSTFTWSNDALTDDLAPVPGAKRAVFAWIWYPARPATTATTAPYLPDAWQKAQADATGTLMRDYLNHDFARVSTNSFSDAPVSPEQPSYPVVIMRPGGGALTTELTTLAEDLASHGYVVVGFDAPYRSGIFVFPDGHIVMRSAANNPETMGYEAGKRVANKLLPMWTRDAAFVVDQLERINVERFAGKLDLSKLGMFGHSFGGAQALQFCHDDVRCKAAMDIDGMPFGSVIAEGASQPVFFLFSDHSRDTSSEEGRQVRADIDSLYSHLRGPKQLVMIGRANHFTFTDQMATKSSLFIRAFVLVMRSPSAMRGLEITRAYVHTFFDTYLKGAPVGELDELSRTYPEIRPFDAEP